MSRHQQHCRFEEYIIKYVFSYFKWTLSYRAYTTLDYYHRVFYLMYSRKPRSLRPSFEWYSPWKHLPILSITKFFQFVCSLSVVADSISSFYDLTLKLNIDFIHSWLHNDFQFGTHASLVSTPAMNHKHSFHIHSVLFKTFIPTCFAQSASPDSTENAVMTTDTWSIFFIICFCMAVREEFTLCQLGVGTGWYDNIN
jgi:hypothetical protein